MNEATDFLLDHSIGSILPSQFNDFVRRRSSGFDGERRLLWAVLEDGIDTYLDNMSCVTDKQRSSFEEIRGWFRLGNDEPSGLFSFETICDLLEIDSGLLLKGIESIRDREIRTNPSRSRAPRPSIRLRRLAA